MLIERGYKPELFLVGGKSVHGSAILQDPSGSDWPKSEALIVTFRKTGKPLKRIPKAVREDRGHDYQPKEGRLTLPPRRLSLWTEIGPVERGEWWRRGQYASPEGFEHVFGERGKFSFGSKALPVLYRRGDAMRLVGVQWDHHGARG